MQLSILSALLLVAASTIQTSGATIEPRAAQPCAESAFDFGGFSVDAHNHYVQIMPKSARDANVDITNDGPGTIFILVWDSKLEFTEYELQPGESMVIGVVKGGGFGIGLQQGSNATGTYSVS